MDKLRNFPIVSRLKNMFHPAEGPRFVSVHFVWHFILGATLLLAITLALLAWFSYQWAVKEEALPFSRTSRDAFSIEELHGVIEAYEKMESEHSALRQSRPMAPSLEAGVRVAN